MSTDNQLPYGENPGELGFETKKLELGIADHRDGVVQHDILKFEVDSDGRLSIGMEGDGRARWFVREADLKVSRALRDFLNYAIPG